MYRYNSRTFYYYSKGFVHLQQIMAMLKRCLQITGYALYKVYNGKEMLAVIIGFYLKILQLYKLCPQCYNVIVI